MNNLFKPLSDEEIESLDEFLLDRINEDADAEFGDEGVLDVSELDGLFTAIVSGPVVIPPSRWLPVVWGDSEPEWQSRKEFEDIFALMLRHMNSIAGILIEQPNDFEPIFLESNLDGEVYTVVDEWCEGYMNGVALATSHWSVGDSPMSELLAPIRAFTLETDWRGHKLTTDAEVVQLQDSITPNVREIHAWWLARRGNQAPSPQLVHRSEPRVGRNDPCPCGSGKKYKKCCLH